jgi:LAS superfamily LD-carboxypeptidase LdcB
MKKILFLLAFITSVSVSAVAQQTETPEQMQQKMRDRIKPELVSKTGITEAQADKVIDINFSLQKQRREIRNDQVLTPEEKAKKNSEIDAARDKEYSGIPLTDEQIKSVNLFFDEIRKQKKQ